MFFQSIQLNFFFFLELFQLSSVLEKMSFSQRKYLPSRKRATSIDQTASKVWSRGKAESQFLWLHNASSHSGLTPSSSEPLSMASMHTLCLKPQHMLPQASDSLLFLRLIQKGHLSTVPAFFGSYAELLLTSTVELKSDSMPHQFSA